MIKQLHQKLINKEISAVELTQQYLDRIKKSDFNSFITILESEALESAKKVDEKILAGEKISELEGIPISIKDVIQTKNIKTTAGSKILEDYIAPYDATLVEKLKEQGVIILGKNNCDEFAMGGSNENSSFGPVKNPHNKNLVSGGSSGGSAVAVADNLSVFSIGTDTGGSIRQPSAFCGVVGLKPTYGNVSRNGLIAMTSSFDQAGPICKSVEDAKIVYNIISGKDNLDATSLKHLGTETLKHKDNLSGLKIGVPKEYFQDGIGSEIKLAVEDTIDQTKKLGAKIVEVSLPHTEYALSVYYIIMFAESSSNLARFDGIRYGQNEKEVENLFEVYAKSRGKFLGEEVKRRILLGTYVLSAGYYDAYYKKAQQVRTLIQQDFEKVFSSSAKGFGGQVSVDLLITPVTPNFPWTLNEKKDNPLSMYLEDIFTVPINIAGVPALSMPCAKSKSGLPIGVQLISKWQNEDILFNVGEVLEKQLDLN